MKTLILCLLVGYVLANPLVETSDACNDVWCKAGRECVVLAGKGECLCVVSCPDHLKPVCGSDGNSYDNHCKLHQQACLTDKHIKVQHKGYCKKKNFNKKLSKDHDKLRRLKLQHEVANDLVHDFFRQEKKQNLKKDSDPLPAVCYGPQRDALRFLLVEHWEQTLKNQTWYREGMTFKENLWGRFFACDSDKNNYVTPEEIIACTSQVPFFARPGQNNKITKALCVDALVDDGDDSRDYRLDFDEFSRILNPDYKPKVKRCSLEGKKFVDGDEVHLDCNHCICAVGKWVCAATVCTSEKERKSHPHGNHLNNHIGNELESVEEEHVIERSHRNTFNSMSPKVHVNMHKQRDDTMENSLKEIKKLKSKTHKMKKYFTKQLFEEPHKHKKYTKFEKKHHMNHHKKHHNHM